MKKSNGSAYSARNAVLGFDPETAATEAADHARQMAERGVVFTPQTVSPGIWFTPSYATPREE